MEQHSIKVSRTAHYSTYGKGGPQTKYLILACHGYGQLAKRFIRKFDVFDPEQTFVVAPEGLSRFYWQGFTGDVVASWMTREDRLDEIEDYTNFIQRLYEEYTAKLPKDVKIILFGFSQGCATVVRWMMRFFPKADYLVCWAGMIPEDLDYQPHLEYFDQMEPHFIYGTEDELLTPERLVFVKKVMQETGIRGKHGIQEHTFEGKHQVVRSVLKDWFEKEVVGS